MPGPTKFYLNLVELTLKVWHFELFKLLYDLFLVALTLALYDYVCMYVCDAFLCQSWWNWWFWYLLSELEQYNKFPNYQWMSKLRITILHDRVRPRCSTLHFSFALYVNPFFFFALLCCDFSLFSNKLEIYVYTILIGT